MNTIKNDILLKKTTEDREIDEIKALIRDIEQVKRSLNVLNEHLQNAQCIGSRCLDRKTVYTSLGNILEKIRNDREIAETLYNPESADASSSKDSTRPFSDPVCPAHPLIFRIAS